jgi:hypothetical protein
MLSEAKHLGSPPHPFADDEILCLRAALKNSPETAYVRGTGFHGAVVPHQRHDYSG